MKILCIYHGNCADGFTSAWVVRNYFKDRQVESIEFHAGKYGEEPPNCEGKKVIIVDFSYSREILEKIRKFADGILVIDHHKSAQKDLEHLPIAYCDGNGWLPDEPTVYACFDMNRSGAMLTWDYFYKREANTFIKCIQDRDLWKFELSYTKEISANIFSYEYTFDNWDKINWELTLDDSYMRFVQEGASLLRKHQKDIREYIGVAAYEAVFEGFNISIINCPYQWGSDACHILCKDKPFAMYYYDTDNIRVFGLRSDENGVDVSEIAKKYGGGGHKHAAGFKIKFEDIETFDLT